jgi:glycosyltransferase involved in cell wall biosynthesis
MRFSIIIPAHNRARKLDQTIGTLVAQDFPSADYELIVADNRSTDDTRQVVEGWQGRSPVSIVYHFEERPGVHYARNAAAMMSKSEVLYFTDDDMKADRGVLAAFQALLDLHPAVAVATGRVLPQWEAEPPPWVLHSFNNGNLSLQYRDDEPFVSAADPGVWSCHEIIRKDVLVACGGFRPENTAGAWVGDGETGLHLEVQAQGYQFGFTNRAVTYHLIPAERLTQTYFNRRLANQGAADSFTHFNRGDGQIEPLRRQRPLKLLRSAIEWARLLRCRLTSDPAWHLHQANIHYWLARYRFDGRLCTDADFRSFVRTKSWLDRPQTPTPDHV